MYNFNYNEKNPLNPHHELFVLTFNLMTYINDGQPKYLYNSQVCQKFVIANNIYIYIYPSIIIHC